MKRYVVLIIMIVSILFSGCSCFAKEASNSCSFENIEYCEWYRDINNTGVYNYTKYIELVVWFDCRVDKYDWSGTTFDLYYDGGLLRSDMEVGVCENYLVCYFDVSYRDAVLTDNWFLAPGTYEIKMKDSSGDEVLASSCVVTANSGDALSQMIVSTQLLKESDEMISFRIDFSDDITPYSNTGFYIELYQDNIAIDTNNIQYSIELADTFMIVKCSFSKDDICDTKIAVYCGDGSFVCDQLLISKTG